MNLVPVNAFQDNYIWVLSDGTATLAVDPGDAGPLINWLNAQDSSLDWILVTHHHRDHTGGLDALRHRFPNVRVAGPANISGVTDPVGAGHVINIGTFKVGVLATPGHTLDHLAYVVNLPGDPAPVLFCGDTLFSMGCGRLFEGDATQMLDSLDQLANLPAATRVCCAHEYTLSNLRFARHLLADDRDLAAYEAECQTRRRAGLPTVPSRLSDECRLNPFLGVDREDVRDAVSRRAGQRPDTRVQCFASLRQLKDEFRG